MSIRRLVGRLFMKKNMFTFLVGILVCLLLNVIMYNLGMKSITVMIILDCLLVFVMQNLIKKNGSRDDSK